MRKVRKIEDVYSGLIINENYICYFGKDFKLKSLNTKNLLHHSEFSFERDFEFRIINGLLYVSKNSELQVYCLTQKEYLKSYKTDKQYIIPLSSERLLASTYLRKSKDFENVIMDESCQVLFELNGKLSYRDIHKEHILFSNRKGTCIGLINSQNFKMLWQTELIDTINGISIDAENLIIIPLANSLVALEKESSLVVWSNSQTLPHYEYDKGIGRLFGLNNKKFQILNARTGRLEFQTDLFKDLIISSQLTYYHDRFLYFSGYQNNNVPVVGAITVENGALEFLQEIDIPGEKSQRNGLERPVVVGNRLYVRDTLKNLHVFQEN